MKRREFFIKSAVAGLGTAAYLKFGNNFDLFANTKTAPDNIYDLVAIKGGEADVMFNRAINSLGGMKRFVKPNQTVVVKPNIGWDVSPERAGNTNPKLVKQIVKECFDAGAKDVYVFDNTCDNWTKCYKNSGIENAVKEAKGKLVSGANESYYQEIAIPNGKRLKEAKVHELVLNSDVFINVPILKNHGGAKLTVAMKNLMGVVLDRGYWHRNDLHQCIADYATLRQPDLNVVDAYYVMKRNGPRGVSEADVVTMKSQLISTDMVAVDAAAAKLFGFDPNDIDHIVYANQMNVGTMDLTKLKIDRISL
ncbi:MAG: DUF362 domain-containing protein [Melioribacteraceae bacterium]|nr:DUF362 domain-containing protein [Melioribacteraceae bacterium]